MHRQRQSRVSTYLLPDNGSKVTFVRTGETGPFRPRPSSAHKNKKKIISMRLRGKKKNNYEESKFFYYFKTINKKYKNNNTDQVRTFDI